MAKPVNPDVKQVALEVLDHCFEEALLDRPIEDHLYWADPEYKAMPDGEAKAYLADVNNFIEAILEGEITMRKPKR